ncbi:PIG-L family deacetylase [Croceivirga thetidis]|uniref:LmbE family protein n=1 Tax=Croceivirga thetidis TaxID=2721623 RepID=A0ABX1GSU3_9FLAO|nr:PIG-L family deacetylase [Croceivirga thetidis]NKI32076.1 LmbE family protein [Croceivirga thetidis]
MPKFNAVLLFALFYFLTVQAQNPKNYTPSELHHEIQKLNFLGTALYVAAHPDDENQRIISYLDNNVKARTIYLSITRGDGGQNLIGPELKEMLGVLRTQELLQARSIDGGEQRFTRAVDFGYSKHPDETLAIWDKEKVLGDVVRVIRDLKPDIIINRFDHRSPGTTHGHHTTSAMLSFEAFDLTNDPNSYSEQLSTLDTWQPKRLFFNTSWWFYGSRENFEKADKSNLASVDIGVYYPELGLSNNEIAAMARSQHKCQGFGQLTSRGSTGEYVEFLKGDPLKDKRNLFDGINTSWSRINGGDAIGEILDAVEENFNFTNPSEHLTDLVKAYDMLQKVNDEHWKNLKSNHLREIIIAAAGLYLEANPDVASTTPGASVSIMVEAINRSNLPITLKNITIGNGAASLTPNRALINNKKETFEMVLSIPQNKSYSSPYWLKEKGELGVYTVTETDLIGLPENPASFEATFVLDFNGTEIPFTEPVVRKYSKPDKGELFEPFVVLPEITIGFEDDVLIFADGDSKQIPLKVTAGVDSISGQVSLQVPSGWSISPKSKAIEFSKKGESKTVFFTVTPPANESEGVLSASVSVNGKIENKTLLEIAYDHIPKQSVLLPAEAKIVRLDIAKSGNLIGYIQGAGDKVPESLEQIGYQVETLNVDEIQPNDLAKYDGIVMGIRAYNTVDALKFKQGLLLDYVRNGGNLIVQYNTARRWGAQFDNIAPYPLTISRDRVTDEFSPVEIIAKNHDLVNVPNKISGKDFEGWVQERGLYFPNEWSDEFTPILSMYDKGESAKKGSLLVAPYGKGNYIYTGLSFFRELPAGVPGAYKLFANMISLNNPTQQDNNNAKGER